MITTPEESWLKEKDVPEACIAKQQSIINDFKNRSKTLLGSEGVGNEEQFDNNELSQKAQASYIGLHSKSVLFSHEGIKQRT